MVQVSAETVRLLRQQTGAGIMNCKRALEETNGDVEKAQHLLKQRGLASAARVSDRATSEGIIAAYIHSGQRLGAIVEVNCETDFVARTPEVRELSHNLAMQVAAMAPLYVSREEMPKDEGRPPQEVCLLEQPYIKDPTKTVGELVRETIAKVGENIRIRRFSRFALGE